MSVQQYFNEVEAVCQILSGYVEKYTPNGSEPPARPDLEEEFTAIWQAVELLSRGYSYIVAQMQAEAARAALYLPDVVEKDSGLILPGGGLVP